MLPVNGGETNDRTVTDEKNALTPFGMSMRATANAKRKPRSVPHRPTEDASSRLLPSARRV